MGNCCSTKKVENKLLNHNGIEKQTKINNENFPIIKKAKNELNNKLNTNNSNEVNKLQSNNLVVQQKKNNNIINVNKKINKNDNNNINFNSFLIDYNKLLGRGGFGTVYSGIEKSTNKNVAVKIEPKNPNGSYLSNEIVFYNELSGSNKIPKIFWSGTEGEYNVLIMEELGPSLESVFRGNNKKFPFSTVINLGIQMLYALEFIHDKYIIHRDIKPDCFLFGKGNNNSNIYLIDFGFARKYRNPKNGKHIPFIYSSRFVGSLKFSSIKSFRRFEKSRRDDIESLGYILVYFIKGSLPWDGIYDFKDMANKKLSISIDDLCDGLPSQIRDFIKYAWYLGFVQKPDYNYLRNLLMNLSIKSNLGNNANNKYTLFKPSPSQKSINIPSLDISSESSYKAITNQEFDQKSAIVNVTMSEGDKTIIEKQYIGNPDSFQINNILRTKGKSYLNEEQLVLYNTLSKTIRSNRTEGKYLVYRYVDNNYLINEFNFNPTNNLNYNLSKIKEKIGQTRIEKGFMSCAMTDKHVIERNIKLMIKIPKGTNAYITRNKEESEIILNHDTYYQINDAKINNNIIEIDITILKDKEIERNDSVSGISFISVANISNKFDD